MTFILNILSTAIGFVFALVVLDGIRWLVKRANIETRPRGTHEKTFYSKVK